MREEESDIVIACCRDEQDIISTFIDFYLDMGFNRVCLIDNGSCDGTVEQISQHPAHEQITLLIDPQPGYDKRLLDCYEAFAIHATRWCFFIDVDEFILIPGGIKQYAMQLQPEINVLRLPTAEMLPSPKQSGIEPPLLTNRREARFHAEQKIVWKRSTVHKIFCGKHKVELEPYCEYSDEDLFIRHYHTRTEQQFRRKLANRIETEESFDEQERAQLSAFSPHVAAEWLEYSRRLLQPDGWDIETERIRATPWIPDDGLIKWYVRYQRENTQRPVTASPVIPHRMGNPT